MEAQGSIPAPLVLDLIAWVAERPRRYAEVMEAWRSTCPRLTIWEDACDAGLVACRREDGRGTMVRATPAGLTVLARSGRVRAGRDQPATMAVPGRRQTAR